MHKWRAEREKANAMKAGNRDKAATWEPKGPTNIGGRITDVAVHPTDASIVYAAAAEGGVFRTTNSGQRWTPLFDDQPSLSMGALAIDPNDANVIFAGTGEVNPGGGSVAYGGAGLFRSPDQGDTWTCIGLENTGGIGRIRIDPDDSDRIFVAAMGHLWETGSDRGVYRTLDGGTTWERVLYVDDDTGCVDLIMRPDDPDTLYAAMWERLRQPEFYSYGGPNCAVWRTEDGGETWDIVGGGLPAPSSSGGRIGLSLCESQPDVMHAIYADKIGYFDGLYRSEDGGKRWTRTQDSSLSGVYSSYGWWFGNVRTHPVNPDVIFVLGLYFYRSTNGGASYNDASGSMHVDHHGMDFGPGSNPVMYNGNDGGVCRSTNGGTSWAHLPDLPVSQIYRLALDANKYDALYCGLQDNGTARTLTGILDNWDSIYWGDGFQPLVHPNNSNFIWAQYQYGALGFSSSGGYSFLDATNGLSGSDRYNWDCPLVQDPTNADRRYFGTNRVYRSTSSTSWTPISPDLTGGPHSSNPGQVQGTLTTLAVSPLDERTLWAGSDDGHVHVTDNAGASWADVSASLPDRWITSVRTSPYDQRTAYVTISGFRWAEPLPHVFMTEDLGATWTPISGNLPDVPVNDLLVYPLQQGRLFVATDAGVFETLNHGVSWHAFGEGLPNVVVNALGYNEGLNELVAGTYGRSFFSCSTEIHGEITPYGTGLGGTSGIVPSLSGSGDAVYGGEVTVELINGLGGAPALIYAGVEQANLPFKGGTIWVYPILITLPVVLDGTPGSPGAGTFDFSYTAEISGLSVFTQFIIADPGAVKGISMSNGLEIAYP